MTLISDNRVGLVCLFNQLFDSANTNSCTTGLGLEMRLNCCYATQTVNTQSSSCTQADFTHNIRPRPATLIYAHLCVSIYSTAAENVSVENRVSMGSHFSGTCKSHNLIA